MTGADPEVTIRCGGHRRRSDGRVIRARIAVAKATDYDGSWAWHVRGDGFRVDLRLDGAFVRDAIVRGDGTVLNVTGEDLRLDALVADAPRYTLRCRGCLGRADAGGGDVQVADFDALGNALSALVEAGRDSVTLPDLSLLVGIAKRRNAVSRTDERTMR